MQKWEYMNFSLGIHLSAILKVARWELELGGEKLQTEKEVMGYFNKLGAEGWELVASTGGTDSHGNITKIVFFFKRPVAA